MAVSRGQLIEIGGSFRLPDVMSAAGAELVEVGCTNRTHLKDFAAAINDKTAAILVAHQSNFRIVGFTTEPTTGELAELAHAHGLPLFVDQGSGALHDLRNVSIVFFSGITTVPATDSIAESRSSSEVTTGSRLSAVIRSTAPCAPTRRPSS